MLINNSQSSPRHHIKVNALIHLKKLWELLIIFKRVNVANYGCGPCDIRHILITCILITPNTVGRQWCIWLHSGTMHIHESYHKKYIENL